MLSGTVCAVLMVVVEVHRAEQRAVLEQHPEQLADLVEPVLAAPHEVGVVDDDRALLRLEQPDQRLEEHRLARAGGAEQHADLAGRQRQRDVRPDVRAPEGLRQSLDPHLDTGHVASSRTRACGTGPCRSTHSSCSAQRPRRSLVTAGYSAAATAAGPFLRTTDTPREARSTHRRRSRSAERRPSHRVTPTGPMPVQPGSQAPDGVTCGDTTRSEYVSPSVAAAAEVRPWGTGQPCGKVPSSRTSKPFG